MATGREGEQHGRILRRISTPMAGEDHDGSTQLLVGHDLQPASRAAVRFTADLAARLGAYLHVVHVVDLADTPIDADVAEWDEKARAAVEKLHSDARSLLEGFDIGWTYHACHGDPAELLARVAEEHKVLFVAVGATGRNLTRRLMEGGSVSRRLMKRHTLPVLVVPEPPTEPAADKG
ncbi:MAG TPA: universal stress protein [Frankiaceae bacterium]|jgi:nucleotide-binding universal stress UspA family protein|nr:universal stress protein [Frankiaceae bacterium]